MKKQLRELIIGSLLGDAHIGRTGLDKTFVSFEQAKHKADYLNHIYQLMKSEDFPLNEPKFTKD